MIPLASARSPLVTQAPPTSAPAFAPSSTPNVEHRGVEVGLLLTIRCRPSTRELRSDESGGGSSSYLRAIRSNKWQKK